MPPMSAPPDTTPGIPDVHLSSGGRPHPVFAAMLAARLARDGRSAMARIIDGDVLVNGVPVRSPTATLMLDRPVLLQVGDEFVRLIG